MYSMTVITSKYQAFGGGGGGGGEEEMHSTSLPQALV